MWNYCQQIGCFKAFPGKIGSAMDRLERVRELLAPELDGEAMGSISQFYDATSLRPSGDLTGISEALLAGTGKISHEERILESAVVTKRLISVFRTVPSAEFPGRLYSTHIQLVGRTIVNLITTRAIDIVLMDPLPVVKSPTCQDRSHIFNRRLEGSASSSRPFKVDILVTGD